jgi:protein-S-isoprenylcysteine O-methyltransferase Ste14
MIILSWLTLVFWLILWCYWLISAFRAKKSVHGGSWWRQAFGIRLALLAIILFVIYSGHGAIFRNLLSVSTAPAISNVFLSALGVVLCAAGIAFAIWARVYLGANWGRPMSLREKPELITSGPYQFVRHPIYSGFLLAMFGTGLADGTTWLLILIVMGIYFIYSAKTEEKMMLKEFPEKYPAYMKKTKTLIPFVL